MAKKGLGGNLLSVLDMLKLGWLAWWRKKDKTG